MSNPIEQAIEALKLAEEALGWHAAGNSEASMPEITMDALKAIRIALSALQSLQGVELPEPVAHMNLHGVIHEAGYQWLPVEKLQGLYTADQLRTAVAAAMARGAVPQADWAADAREWGDALNAAGWEFDDAYRRHMGEPASAKLFNLCKAIIRDVILCYASRLSAAPTPEATQPTQAEREVTSREHSVLMSAARRSGKVVHDATQADPICSKCRWPLNAHDTGEPCQPTQAEAPSEREAFEAWAKDEWDGKSVPDAAWLGWKGRAALATQQAAYHPGEGAVREACDIITKVRDAADHWGGGWSGTKTNCDAAINLLRYGATQQAGQGEAMAQWQCIGYVEPYSTEITDLPQSPRYTAVYVRATPPAPQQPEALAQQEREWPQEVLDWVEAESVRIAAVHTYNAAQEAAKQYEFGAVDLNPHYQRMNATEKAARQLIAPMYAALVAAIRAARSSEGGSHSPSMVGREDTTHG